MMFDYMFCTLTLKMLIITAADNISIFLFLLFREDKMAYHVSYMLGRWLTWNAKTHFLWKIIEKKFRMMSATILLSTFSIN